MVVSLWIKRRNYHDAVSHKRRRLGNNLSKFKRRAKAPHEDREEVKDFL